MDPTVTGGTNSLEAQEAIAQGFDVDVVSAAAWSSMTAAQFASYRAIVLGDPTCGSSPSPYLDAPLANESVWGPVVNGPTGGNVIIIGTDPVYHASTQAGARHLIKSAMDFVLNTEPGKTGIYVDLSCYYGGSAPNTPVPLLDVFSPGGFTVRGPDCTDSGHIVATTSDASLGSLTDADLSSWHCSVHEAFDTFDPSFDVVAIDKNAGASFTASDGTQGDPYILARGTNLFVISNIKLTPTTDSPSVGTNETLTATVTSPDGTPLAGATVTFTVISGPNAGKTGTGVTNGAGQTTFTYSSLAAGTDFVHAQFVDSSGHTETSGNARITWGGSSQPTSVSVSNVSVPFTNVDPAITLHTNITTLEGVVNEGQVQFVVTNSAGSQVGQAVTANVSNGQASAVFDVPADTPVGAYTITATYSDPAGNFTGSGGTGTLNVVTSPTTVAVNNVNIVYGLFGEQETLTALVFNALGQVVNQGFVTFSDSGQTVTVPIVNSLATATLNIPVFSENPFAHSITAAYSSNSGNFFASTIQFTIEQTLMDFFLQIMALESFLQNLPGGGFAGTTGHR